MNTLKNQLRTFKLSGIYHCIEERLGYAQKASLSYHDFLALLLEDEANSRRDNGYRKRYAKAKLPAYKTIEDFDFSFQPSMDKRLINDCLTCHFIPEKKNLVFMGNPGTGKTHLSTAIAVNALKKGYKVLFTSASAMLQDLPTSKADNSFRKRLQDYLMPDLLVIDELGFKKRPDYSGDDFFEVISKRYEQGSIIITTNKSFEQWGDIFADSILSSAILDRIVHHSEIIKINGPSYRTTGVKKGDEEA